MISSIKLAHTRKARAGSTHTQYANFDLEDIDGSIRCIMWPEDYAKMQQYVKADAVFIVHGRIERRGGDEANLIINELVPMADLETRYTRGILVCVRENSHGQESLSQLNEIVRGYPGNCEFKLVLELNDGHQVRLQTSRRVDVSPEMQGRIEDLLGEGNFRLQTARPKPNVIKEERKPYQSN